MIRKLWTATTKPVGRERLRSASSQAGTRTPCPEPEQQFSLLQAAVTSSPAGKHLLLAASDLKRLQSLWMLHMLNINRQAESKRCPRWDILHLCLLLVPEPRRTPTLSSAGESLHFIITRSAARSQQSPLAAHAHCCPVSRSQSFQLLPSLPSFLAAPSIPEHHSFQKQLLKNLQVCSLFLYFQACFFAVWMLQVAHLYRQKRVTVTVGFLFILKLYTYPCIYIKLPRNWEAALEILWIGEKPSSLSAQ